MLACIFFFYSEIDFCGYSMKSYQNEVEIRQKIKI